MFNKMKIVNYILITLFLVIMVLSYFAQERSYAAKMYTGQAQETFAIVALSSPALIMVYNPKDKTVQVTTAALPKPKKDKKGKTTPLTPAQQAQKLLELKKIDARHFRYAALNDAESNAVWDTFKHTLTDWRFNPLIMVKYAYNYAWLYAKGLTNVPPAEFALLTLMTLDMDITDFAVTLPAKTAAASTTASAANTGGNSPFTAQDRPLIVEIYNGSGIKGAALELTQYLRSLKEKGFMEVDVFQYDNHPVMVEKTRIIDHSGRQKELKQLSLILGIRDSELFAEKSASDFCDAKIIIGKNFKMPR